MKGDFSRWREGAGKNFNGVLPQQGKVLLDGSVAEVVSSELVRTIYAGGAHVEAAP